MPIIDSLVAQLSFDFDSKALEKFDKGMKDAGKVVAAVSAAATVAGAAIFAFTSKIAEQNDEVGKLAQRLGVTAQTINELGFVAQLNGGSINAMNSSLENLGKIASETARGVGSGVEAFGLLGVSVSDANGNIKETDSLLLDVADSIAKLSTQSEKIELLSKLGIDSSLLIAIEQGSAAIREQRKEVEALGFVLDKEATTRAADFNDAMLRLKTVVEGVSSAIGTKLMKQITPMINIFLEWFKANKELIKQNLTEFFTKLTSVINTLYGVGVRVVSVIDRIVEAFGGWQIALTAVAVGLTAVNARALLLPTIIFAVASAIFLLIEDLVAFAEGADSQIGNLAEKFPLIGKAAEGLIFIFGLLSDVTSALFKDGISSIDVLLSKFDKLIQKIKNVPILKQVIDLGYALGGIQKGGGVETGVAPAFLGNIVAPPASQTNNTKEITINVNGGNTEEVKAAVADALSSEFKASELNLSTQTRF